MLHSIYLKEIYFQNQDVDASLGVRGNTKLTLALIHISPLGLYAFWVHFADIWIWYARGKVFCSSIACVWAWIEPLFLVFLLLVHAINQLMELLPHSR